MLKRFAPSVTVGFLTGVLLGVAGYLGYMRGVERARGSAHQAHTRWYLPLAKPLYKLLFRETEPKLGLENDRWAAGISAVDRR